MSNLEEMACHAPNLLHKFADKGFENSCNRKTCLIQSFSHLFDYWTFCGRRPSGMQVWKIMDKKERVPNDEVKKLGKYSSWQVVTVQE